MAEIEFGFTRDRNDAQLVAEYLNPLPRSVVRSNEYELLDGEWRFELDLEDRGLREQWYLGHTYSGTAQWPSSIEQQMAAGLDSQQHTPPWQDEVIAWYEREFSVPAPWCNAQECEIQVTFGACGYETRVWFNGHLLETVEGEEVHFGEYTSFSYELPRHYLRPVNRLTVRVADSLDAEIPRGKQESLVYKRGGIWYHTISGPVRSVWLEPGERNRLRPRLGVVSSVEDRLVEFSVTTRVHDPRVYDLADELGMLLWVEVPSPHSSSQRSRENHRAELLRMLVIAASHPSVVLCSLYNEDWGAQDIATNAETRAYIADTYAFMRLHYPQFLVVDNDGWHHVSVEGELQSDLLTEHVYTPDLGTWREHLDRLVAGDNEGVTVQPLVVGDPFFYRGQVPLVVSEWGGFGFRE